MSGSSDGWDEPFFTRTHRRIRNETYEEAKKAVWDEQYEKYLAMREQRREEASQSRTDGPDE